MVSSHITVGAISVAALLILVSVGSQPGRNDAVTQKGRASSMVLYEQPLVGGEPFLDNAEMTGPSPVPAGAPTHAVVVEHGGGGSRLAIVDLVSRKLRYLGSADETPSRPVWAPDGAHLLYQVDDTVLLNTISVPSDKRIAEGLANETVTPYAFSPNSKWIAVALAEEVLMLPVTATQSSGAEPRRFRIPPQSVIRDLLWSADSRTLLVLLDQASNSRLLRVDRATGQAVAQPAAGVNRLLGWQTSGALVVSRARVATGSGEEAGILFKAGEFRPLRDTAEAEEGEFLLGFLPVTNQVVFVLGREDLGDPIRLFLGGAGHHASVPWLRHFSSLDELALSRDGRWAMFVDRSPLGGAAIGGDIYLVSVGSEAAKLILKAVAEEVSYSSPVPSP